MGPEYLLQADDAAAIMPTETSVITVQRRWLNFLRRCRGLQPGRYIIVLTVDSQACDWSLQEVGRVEK